MYRKDLKKFDSKPDDDRLSEFVANTRSKMRRRTSTGPFFRKIIKNRGIIQD